MTFQQKLCSAVRVLKEDGLGGFMRAVKRNISDDENRPPPDEAQIAFEALKAGECKGLMIDAGAHVGGALAPFAHSGWQVLAFEPDSENREQLVDAFGEFQNVDIDSRAVSDTVSEKSVLYRSDESTGISGLSPFHPSHQPCEEVRVTTLTRVLDEREMTDREITFLKVDTEGFDLNVLKGVPWQANSPELVLCEFEDSKTVPLGYTFHDLADYLVDRGYRLIVSEWYPIRQYGVQHDWRRFALYPCDLEDSRAWGNILAAKTDRVFERLLRICRLAR